MKKLLAVLALVSSLFAISSPSFADTLHFVSDGGQNVGGADIYPYNFNVNGSSTLTSLMCINYGLHITFGETWNANALSIPTDGSQTSIDYRADAYLYSLLGGAYSTADIQYAVWDILDSTDVNGNSAFDSTAQTLVTTAMAQATNQTLINSGFFSNFILYTPTADQTGWTDGQPQSFLGTAQTPEPSSLVLLGSGLFGLAGMARRRFSRS